MRKLVFVFMLIGLLWASPLFGKQYSYRGAVDLLSQDSIASTAACTVEVDLDTLLTRHIQDGNLTTHCRMAYKGSSVAGDMEVDIQWEHSFDGTNWVNTSVVADSLIAETWQVDTLPTYSNFFKYARVVVTGITNNNADTAFWLSIAFYKED